MPQKPLSELSDQELLKEAQNQKATNILDAFIIGLLVGVIVYSVINKSWGVLTIIPVYLIYKLVNKPKYGHTELKKMLSERNLKK